MRMCAISSIEVVHSSAGSTCRPTKATCHQEYDPAEDHVDSHARECSYTVLPEMY